MATLIRGGMVFDPASGLDGQVLDILIAQGKVKQIAAGIPSAGADVLNAAGLWVFPGMIDMHAHLRDPGQLHKETIETGTLSAAHGGVTTLLAMPNTTPPLDEPGVIRQFSEDCRNRAHVEVLPVSALTLERKGLEPVSLEANLGAGAAAFSDDGTPVEDVEVLGRIAHEAKRVGALLIEHPEVAVLTKGRPIGSGEIEQRFGFPGQHPEAESIDVFRFGSIAGMNGARAHLTHISAVASLEALAALKKIYPGLITADVTPHHIALTQADYANPQDASKKMNPPLRSEIDRQALIRALKEGLIDCIATDHAPHTAEEKGRGLLAAPPGSVGFETLVPVTYTVLVKENGFSPLEWLRLLTSNPAKILGIERGKIIEGGRADLVIFNPDVSGVVYPEKLISKSKNTAFAGRTYSGAVMATFCKGVPVFSNLS